MRLNAYAPPARFAPAPMKDLNVTPFIDVLLVLLVMLILTIPIATHVTDIPLPNGKARPADPQINTVSIDTAGTVSWNGTPVSEGELAASVAQAAALPSQPVLRFDPQDAAPYDTSARTIALIRQSGADKFAFARLHEHRDFSTGG
ncbi:ExbD/TolR family protein [Altererythrobacter sp. CAU 1778]